jgi:hypothetical protein
MPAHLPKPEVPVSEALFCRTSLRGGTGYVQTSTWFVSKELMLQVPFTPGLKRNQDADWMLRGLSRRDVSIAILPDTLTIFHDIASTERVSKKADWRFHYDWAIANRQQFSRKALGFFLLTTCVQEAVLQREALRSVLLLVRESFRIGSPTPLSLAFCVYYWLFPERLRKALRAWKREIPACG